MRIGGFVKQSFIDWEGMLSAVVFTKGCNMRCGYCHNPSLVVPSLLSRSADIPPSEIMDYLRRRHGWVDGVVISGGEPTLYDDLPDFINRIRTLGYKIKLDTNGTNPDMLESLIRSHAVDFVAMDIKHIPCSRAYQQVTPLVAGMMKNINRSIRILQRGSIPYQFRTTVVPHIHTPRVREALHQRFAADRYVIYHFRRSGRDGIVSDYL